MSNRTVMLIALLLATFLISGCSKKIPQELLEPVEAELNSPSPDVYKIKFETTKGDFIMEIHRDWSPHGADRLYYLAKHKFYDGVCFFRVVKGFMAQFGYHGEPKVIAAWSQRTIPDDSVKQSNTRGFVSFAKSMAPNSRTTQLFINFGDNSRLDAMGFSPVGKVIEGMEVVDKLYSGYGDAPPNGRGPQQARIQQEGNSYLKRFFPKLDYIKKARLIS